jgi:hypothetical protein
MKPSQWSERVSIAQNLLEPLLSEVECSKITGRSVASLRRDRLLRIGIPHVKLMSLVRYDPRDIRDYIERNKRRGAPSVCE